MRLTSSVLWVTGEEASRWTGASRSVFDYVTRSLRYAVGGARVAYVSGVRTYAPARIAYFATDDRRAGRS
ncbi:hypothetical protein BX283_1389 [Streptomyces sp. TLI_146]|nr:hypothetical protein BX283_1389 [Streptomyces sp. TLI_146]